MKTVVRAVTLSMMVMLVLGLTLSVTAQDDLMSVSAENCDYGGNFLSVEAVDSMTVQFTLCAPDPAFPSKVAFSAFTIHPSEYIESTGGGGEIVQHPIGTGPYKFERWDLGNELVFTRFDDYWGEPAIEPTVIFRWNSEAAARFIELQSGNVDGIDNVGEADFDVVEMDPNYNLFKRGGTNIFYLGINNTVEPFDNVLVRQAVSYAIDRQRIVDNYYPPGSSVATQFMPTSIFGFTSEVDALNAGMTHAEAVAKANELLDEAGLIPGEDGVRFTTTLSFRDVVRSYLPTPGIVAADLQAQLAEIGIDAEIVEMESGAFIDASDAGELSLHLLGWGADYPDATNFLDYHFGGGASDQFGNHIPELVDVLAQAASIADTDARYQLYVQANEIIRDQVPMVPVAHGGNGAAFASRIEGAYASDIGAEKFALMEDPDDDNIIWMQNAEPIGLYCADESDGETLRACEQTNESLLAYEPITAAVIPSLATEWEASDDLTVWTFHLREGVLFHDGSSLDANDVVLSYAVQWDAASPLHVGRNGSFTYFSALFGGFLNPPEE